MTKIICDGCGLDIKDTMGSADWPQPGARLTFDPGFGEPMQTCHYCLPCAKEIVAWRAVAREA